MSDDERLKQVRDRIDAIDADLLRLISERATCAQDVAKIKDERNPGGRHYYRPEREAEILRRIKEQNPGPLDDEEAARLFREIMSACLALENPLSVGYLGPEGTFTQAAALKHFGHSVQTQPFGAIGDIFREVEAGSCNFGVVPVENSTEGMVSHTLDSFLDSPLKIAGEVELRIVHHLLAAEHTTAEAVTRICAHQQALAQCRAWLDRHWPTVERQAVSSNGEAARMAAATPGVAAIAGDIAAELYGLHKLGEHIEDHPDNTTRFLVVGREEVPPSGRDKTSLIVASRNKPGALFALLDPFRRAGVNLTRIDTRPSRTEKWAYVFFIEFEGHLQDEKVAGIVRELEEQSILLKPLGSYPRAVL